MGSRAAKIEWAFIKGRLSQPFTWTGKDLVHALFWGVNVFAGFCAGEILGRWNFIGYDVVDPSWQPVRPQFAPGFWHLHAGHDNNYPFEQYDSSICGHSAEGTGQTATTSTTAPTKCQTTFRFRLRKQAHPERDEML